jgi:RNA polymerase sigma-70 factor (ECF subfamily)
VLAEARTDPELMARVKAGDEHALAALYDRHAPLVFSLACAIVHDDDAAEEVTEAVFLQLWTGAGEFDEGRGTLRAWLATMARTRALDHVRSRRRRQAAHERAAAQTHQEGLAVELSEFESPDASILRTDERNALERALHVLTDDQRRAIELAYFGGLTQSEIARALNEPLGTIKTRIRDGMSRLRSVFSTTRERAP